MDDGSTADGSEAAATQPMDPHQAGQLSGGKQGQGSCELAAYATSVRKKQGALPFVRVTAPLVQVH